MKKLSMLILYFLTGCVNAGTITSGQLIANETKIDISGKEIILNEDCSIKEIHIDIPYCGEVNLRRGDICTIERNMDKKQRGYKTFQVINKNDVLACAIGPYGVCNEIIYIKNLGKLYTDLVDNALIPEGYLIKIEPYSYESILQGKKTINGYELITKMRYYQIQYKPDNLEKCPIDSATYSSENNKDWSKDK